MKPKEFDFVRAETVDEVLAELADNGEDAKIIAGGQSLMAMLNLRLVEPQILIDIAQLETMSYVRIENGHIEVGATTTQGELMAWPELNTCAPLLDKALPYVGHFQTRNRGTVCGSLAHADPSSEIPLSLAVLGGAVVLRSAKGERVVDADDFQTGMLATSRRPDEMITAARFPLAEPGVGYAFREMARRRGDFAIVSVAASVSDNAIRVGIGGVADQPTVRQWPELAGEELDDALNAFAWELGGYDDIHATAKYRRRLVRRLGRQVIEEARSCRS